VKPHHHDGHEKRADRIGIVASAICGVHCFLGALLAGASGLGHFLREPWLEYLLVGTALSVAVWALVRGYRAHGSPMPLRTFAFALPWIFAARLGGEFGPWSESILSMIGAGSLIVAHVLNLRALAACAKKHRCCAHHA
jgi:hypothetical protein